MLATIRKTFRARGACFALLFLGGGALVSCATKPDPQLVADPSAARESALPWNRQEKWEAQGAMGPMAERYNDRGNH